MCVIYQLNAPDVRRGPSHLRESLAEANRSLRVVGIRASFED